MTFGYCKFLPKKINATEKKLQLNISEAEKSKSIKTGLTPGIEPRTGAPSSTPHDLVSFGLPSSEPNK